jgi:2-amino-4-hydroxy-6-hydroxymethyldihydropteridine diphosphokinase
MLLPPVFLGLGSNRGDRAGALAKAEERLAAKGFRTTARSALYLTEPVGGPPQEWFLNAVLQGETPLAPEELLAAGLEVERDLGRVRGERFGPRTIDIDLLLYGTERREGPGLTLPHPRMHERLFVLAPLAEIAPAVLHPALGLTAQEMLRRCPDRHAVRRLQPQVR